MYFSSVFSRNNMSRVFVSVFLIIGMCAFAADVLNPETPTPLIWPRIVELARLVFAVISLLLPVLIPVPHIVYQTGLLARQAFALAVRYCDYCDVLNQTCVQRR